MIFSFKGFFVVKMGAAKIKSVHVNSDFLCGV